jgi:bifunctional UDP-N-acetylglucosamine pyrophosphorylase/glucosamine-1-phosphate N-acetyltransferase
MIHGPGTLSYVEQKEAKGTGHALLQTLPSLRKFQGPLLVVNGDSPLLTATTIRNFLAQHRRKKNDLSLMSFIATDPGSYGRILRDVRGRILSIVEDRDATAAEREIREVNAGVYAIEPRSLLLLKKIRMNPVKREYYLTDIVHISRERGLTIDAFCADSEDEFIGINTRRDLNRVGQLMRSRIVERWREQGVDFLDAGSVFISQKSSIGKGTVIYPNVHIEGVTKLGRGCTIFPNVRILNSTIGDGSTIKDSTLIERSLIKKNATVGPFAHLRPGSVIGEHAKIGNFVEVKNSEIGSDTKASHLSYLGDAKIGKGVNIGAGTITCNYDGYHKYVTTIEDNVFVGSDSQFIAPVTVARGAVIGAGSTITGNVPAHALALSRVEQTNVEGWVLRRKKSRQYVVDSTQEKKKKKIRHKVKNKR